jgi:hypothetical protein
LLLLFIVLLVLLQTPEQEALFNRLQIELDNKRYAKHVLLLFIALSSLSLLCAHGLLSCSMVKNVVATKDMKQGKRKNEFREAMNQVRPSLSLSRLSSLRVADPKAGYL